MRRDRTIGPARMHRRTSVAVATFVAAALALGAALGQERARRVAILGPAEEPRFSEIVEGLKLGLRDHGYGPASLELIEIKVARGDRAGARAHVAEKARLGLAILFSIGSELAKVARSVSAELQIVFITPGDPVAAGLVASLSRPGGNTTAMTFEYPELSAKRLELLKELAPGVRRVLVVYDPRDASSRQNLAAARAAAPRLGMALIEREARSGADVARGLEALGGADALLAIPGGIPSGHYAEMIDRATALRVPTFFHTRGARAAQALASYGASDARIARQAARLVDKILRGERAGDLPVERPANLELIVNLRTARALDLAIPDSVLVRADKVIE